MSKQELYELLKAMRDLNTTYSEESISDEQYVYYKSQLDDCPSDNEKETIRRIVYELDIEKPAVARSIAYPFNFDSDVRAWVDENTDTTEYYCAACKKNHPLNSDDLRLRLTLDHEPSLSSRFNHGEWELDRPARHASYNDTDRLQIMCQSQNSSKGGEHYDKNKIQAVFIREL